MIDLNLFFALVSFYFVMYVTPGPNNAMVLTSGLKFGFAKTIPHMSGITIGHILQLILVCLGLGKIFQVFPEIQQVLKIICAAYLLYLGYKIIGSFSKIKEDDSRPLKFHEAALFQIVNPKAWTISSMAASGFLPKGENLIFSILYIAAIAIIVIVGFSATNQTDIIDSTLSSISEPLLVNVDQTTYQRADIISISGNSKSASTQLVELSIENTNGVKIWNENINLKNDGKFSTLVIAGGGGWENDGTYILKATHSNLASEIEFKFFT